MSTSRCRRVKLRQRRVGRQQDDKQAGWAQRWGRRRPPAAVNNNHFFSNFAGGTRAQNESQLLFVSGEAVDRHTAPPARKSRSTARPRNKSFAPGGLGCNGGCGDTSQRGEPAAHSQNVPHVDSRRMGDRKNISRIFGKSKYDKHDKEQEKVEDAMVKSTTGPRLLKSELVLVA